jgi:site-specific DNA-methyltransferase (adenine-specific)
MAGARRRVGYARYGRGMLLTDKLSPPRRGTKLEPVSAVDYYLQLAYATGCPTESPQLELSTLPDDERHADTIWERFRFGQANGVVQNDDRADWREAWALFPGDVAYVWHGALHAGVVQASLEASGFAVRSQIIWVKQRPVFSRGHYHWQHEPALYAERTGEGDHGAEIVHDHELGAYVVRVGRTGHWNGDRRQSTVWQIDHMKNDTGHGTQKPVECMRRPIVNNSSPGQVVYDPFLGSGTTLIAAETEGRACYGSELWPAYVDVIVRRWQEFTGLEATLDGDGRTFAAIAAERTAAAEAA